MKKLFHPSRWLAILLCAMAATIASAQQLDPLEAYIDSLARVQARQQGPHKAKGAVIPIDQLSVVDLSKKAFQSYLSRKAPLTINASVRLINGTISAASTFTGNGPLLKVAGGVTVMLDETAAIDASGVSSTVCTAAVGVYGCSTFIQNGDVTAPNSGRGVAIHLDTDCDSYQYLSGETNGSTEGDDTPLLGDVNADGVVNLSDAICIFNKLLEKSLPVYDATVADYNQDGQVTASDGIAIIGDL